MANFGALGYLLRKMKFDVAPLLLAVILGARIALAFRRSLTISDGDFSIFIQSTSSAVFLCVLVIIVVLQLTAWLLGYRKKNFADEDPN